jgi:peroxiredoxin Q/BCP
MGFRRRHAGSYAVFMIAIGDPAPDFTLLDEQEREVRLSDLRGSWVVLWWYPKASTSG